MSERHENTQRVIEVSETDLPLHCPMPQHMQWNAHPRVYLPIDSPEGQAERRPLSQRRPNARTGASRAWQLCENPHIRQHSDTLCNKIAHRKDGAQCAGPLVARRRVVLDRPARARAFWNATCVGPD